MPKKNRLYKKGEPYRDASFLIIACEGAKREKIYFEMLANRNQRVKIKILAPAEDKAGLSAPHWILERAISFTEEIGANKYDTLWFVLDTDLWKREILEEIKTECKDNWFIALSNPCFEVWLIMHYLDPSEITSTTSKQLKRELNVKILGGYKVEIAVKNVKDAFERAKRADISDHFIPVPKTTKVYKVVDQIINKQNGT
jgi:hypothetical protein